jgi:hypothetical protein
MGKTRYQSASRRRAIAAAIAVFATAMPADRSDAGVIFVTSTEQKISATGGCSLPEAIAAANYDNNIAIKGYDANHDPLFIQTQCYRKGDVGDPSDLIVLPVKATFLMDHIVDDADNYMGPTATPMITSNITIDAKGSTLQYVPTFGVLHAGTFHTWPVQTWFRAFAVDSGGSLELRSAYVRGFVVHGGNGGFISGAESISSDHNDSGGGGGMGAGGAIYVRGGNLLISGSTFEGNGAIGGDGARKPGGGGGGGGGLGGWGGPSTCGSYGFGVTFGGGGGGSRGYGMGSCTGPGGGTLSDGTNSHPGFDCGGQAGDRDGDLDGRDAPCEGGGGGGGVTSSAADGGGDGGKGAYGGGGGGGSNGGGGGSGGFGGGGGSGHEGWLLGHTGGDGGFGGGGGAGDGDDPGRGGRYDGASFFGGNGGSTGGGGGGGLGGAIFNHEGSVVVQNSTFSGNFVARGNGGNHGNPGGGGNGGDAGAAIFTVNGQLTVEFTTVDGNEATGTDGGIVVVQTSAVRPTSFYLYNTIITNNGANECRVQGPSVSSEFLGNLIGDNVNCGTPLSGNPLLGTLFYNQGLTPTKALSEGSPAINAADPAVFLAIDQRGQERAANTADIGAFERCVVFLGDPCLILGGNQEIDFVKLTMSLTPAGGGTTTPAVGAHDVELNSVVALTATPSASYRFASWSGDVGDATSASTFIAMDDDKSVTANFELFDFNFSAIQAFAIPVGGNGSKTVTVNSMGVFNVAVALSASGLPGGAFASFNPGSVTPVAGQSAPSQLTVSLAPWALPGSYNFNVTGNGGGRQHSRAVSLTIAATAAGITNVINTLLGLGCIDSAGVSNAFTTKLAQAQAAINAGDTKTAVNILSALLNQLQAQSGKHLKTTCTANGQTFNPATVLITQVQSLLASLGVTFRANPLMGNVLGPAGVEVRGAAVSLLKGSRTVATAETDATGFYFFANTSGLASDAGYSVKVSRLPKPYKKSTPATQSFTWRGSATTFNPFVLN